MDAAVRICVLISGSGSNLQALMDALDADPPAAPAEICLVVSSKGTMAEERENTSPANPYGLARVRKPGIRCERLTPRSLPQEFRPQENDSPDEKKQRSDRARVEYDRRLAQIVLGAKPDLVVCLGYMRVLLPEFLQQMKEHNVEIINLHPALPGEYDGTQAIERAHQHWLEGKIKRTGVMIHRVIEAVDAGEVVVKQEIPFVDPEDRDISVFERKLHQVEWKLVIKGVSKVVGEIRANRETCSR